MSAATATVQTAEPTITMEAFKALLGRPIAFHRSFATISGSVTAGLMLSQAYYWSDKTKDPDGWFWKTQEQWEEETGLGRYEQETARKQLVQRGLMQECRRGIPARLYFRLNFPAIVHAMNQAAAK